HRYLHQDELGPTRAERLAALRLLLDQLDLFLSRLNGFPVHLRPRLSRRLPSDCGSVEHELDKFQAHCHDEEAVPQVGEAAAGESSRVGASPMANDAELMDEIRHAAENTTQLLSLLDTTTEGAVVLDTEWRLLKLA